MNKNTKIIVMLVLAFAILAAYLFLTIKEVTIKTKVPQSSEEYNRQVQENIKKMEAAYQSDMKSFVAETQAIIDNPNLDQAAKTDSLLRLRENLKTMTVPAQYKELHMNLFLAFSELSSDSQKDFGTVINEISNLINEAKSAISWLN